MSLVESIDRNWHEARSSIPGRYRDSFTPAEAVVSRALAENLTQLRMTLDAGCGDGPYRGKIERAGGTYFGIDLDPRAANAVVGDVQAMAMFADASFDTVLSTEVLEHLPKPESAIAEMRRVLRTSGTALITVPHLSRLHEQPHDYFRFTEHALRFLLESNGFRVEIIEPLGGLACFLGHQFATVLVGSTWHLRPLRPLVLRFLHHVVTPLSIWFDRSAGTQRIMPLGYFVRATAVDARNTSDVTLASVRQHA